MESSDVLDRRLKNGVLYSTRLLIKEGKIPKWGRAFLKSNSQALILEESEVDPRQQIMVTRTRNLTLKGIMCVEETQTYRPHPERQGW